MIKEGMLTLSILSTLLGSNNIQLKEPLRQEVKVSSTYERTTELDKISQKVGFEVSDVTLIEFKCTYYTSLPSENGGYTVTCEGKPLEGNIVANNTLPLGAKILLNDKHNDIPNDRLPSEFRNLTTGKTLKQVQGDKKLICHPEFISGSYHRKADVSR